LIRVWIETHSTILRAGLAALLRDHARIELLSTPEEADVILREEAPEGPEPEGPPLVVLTDDTPTARALQWGVRAILPRDAPADQIVAAIHAVAEGLCAVPADAAAQALLLPAPGMEPLTPRESEVLEMLAEGIANKEIAARLHLSEHTVKFHVNAILGKLHAGTRTEAVTRAIRHGILKI
jgi:DNA-binding NarL/FixJ family response regulator